MIESEIVSGWYTAQKGDCISSIAFKNGFFWQTLWDDPKNADLRKLRKDPNVLAEGDSVFIPDLRKATEDCPTDAQHSFVLKGVPAKLKLRLLVNKQPRKNVPYTLIIDGKSFKGQTDSDGRLEQPIPPDASQGKLVIVSNGVTEEHALVLGDLDPLDKNTGIKDRLVNLGYACDTDSDAMTDKFRQALSDFQADNKLPQTGEPDAATQQKLQQLHGF
jgi:hypothetical protein